MFPSEASLNSAFCPISPATVFSATVCGTRGRLGGPLMANRLMPTDEATAERQRSDANSGRRGTKSPAHEPRRQARRELSPKLDSSLAAVPPGGERVRVRDANAEQLNPGSCGPFSPPYPLPPAAKLTVHPPQAHLGTSAIPRRLVRRPFLVSPTVRLPPMIPPFSNSTEEHLYIPPSSSAMDSG